MAQITIKKGRDGLADCQEPETSERVDEKTANSKKWRLSYSKVIELLGAPRDQRKLSAWFKQFRGCTSCNVPSLVLAEVCLMGSLL